MPGTGVPLGDSEVKGQAVRAPVHAAPSAYPAPAGASGPGPSLEEQAQAAADARRPAVRLGVVGAAWVGTMLALPIVVPAIPLVACVAAAVLGAAGIWTLGVVAAMRGARVRDLDQHRRCFFGRVACADCGTINAYGVCCARCGVTLPLPEDVGVDPENGPPPRASADLPAEHWNLPYWVRARWAERSVAVLFGGAALTASVGWIVLCTFVFPQRGWIEPGHDALLAPVGVTLLTVPEIIFALQRRATRRAWLAGIGFLAHCPRCTGHRFVGAPCPRCGSG